MLPVFAVASFDFAKPKGWDRMSKKKKREAMLSAPDLERTGGLCHQCTSSIESDFEIVEDNVDLDTYYECD